MTSQKVSKTEQIGSLILELLPLIAEKACVGLRHQCSASSFDRIFMKLADQVDMEEVGKLARSDQ